MEKGSANIYTVAERAGVSIATVSRVQRGNGAVAPGTREKVLRAIEDLRFKPSSLARGLAERRHGAMGIVFPDLSGPYYSEVILGYEKEAISGRQSVLILGTHGRENAAELVFDLASKVDGLMVMGRTVEDAVVEEMDSDGVPLVLLARPGVNGIPVVRSENIESAMKVTEHVFSGGRRRVEFVGDPSLSPDTAERWEGFVEAHRRMGVEPPEEPVRSGFTQEEGEEAVGNLLDGEARPDAIVCANDEISLGAYGAARKRGIEVPRDLAVTGWDDIPLARFVSPALTTVRQPMRELGSRAAKLLMEKIKAPGGEYENVVLPTELIVRESG